jgi:penicillin amidase
MLAQPHDFWCAADRCQASLNLAMDKALNRLSASLGPNPTLWRWGDLHPAISAHRPFGSVPVLNRVFDERVASAGDLFTVNVGQYWANDKQMPFANRHAASLRAVYDLADLEPSQFIYQTGQSGHSFDGRSRDMAKAWAGTAYRPLQQHAPQKKHSLLLKP